MIDKQEQLILELKELLQLYPASSDEIKKLTNKLIKNNKKRLTEIGKSRPLLGAHTSIAGGYSRALEQGSDIGADIIAFFVTSPRTFGISPLLQVSYDNWNIARALTGVEPGNVHGSYLVNLASPNEILAENSLRQVLLEMERCVELEAPLYTIHPGSRSLESSPEEALDRVVEQLTIILQAPAAKKTTLCLETTAGSKTGTKLGSSFEEFGYIIKALPRNLRKYIGITIDTCHIWAAGYDISTEIEYLRTMEEFDKEIGLKYLKAIHLNGCASECGGMLDRHAAIGAPPLDLTPFRMLMNDSRLFGVYMTLETPDMREWKNEILMLKQLIGWGSLDVEAATVGGSLEENEYFGEINYGNRAYLVHNIRRPYTVWPEGFWIEGCSEGQKE